MKKFTLFLFVFGILFSLNAQNQIFKYSETWGDAGFNLESQKSSGVEIIYSVKEFSISESDIKGEIMQNINLAGVMLFNDEGMPDLPGTGRMIAIPEGAKAVLKIVDFETELIKNVNLAPAPRIPFDIEKGELEYNKNNDVYLNNSFYPENPIKISDIVQLRGVDAVMLGITPFQYNPVTKDLIVYRNIKIEISFENSSGIFGDDRLRSKWWDPILAQNILNYNSLPKIDYSKKVKSKVDGEAEYVIITLNQAEYLAWADSIKNFRRQQGISTEIYTIDDVGGNSVSAIETWVDNAYNNWSVPPEAILLMADYNTGTTGITSQIYSHPYSGTFITDNKYADIDGDDLPEIVFARMTAQNETHLETMVTKFLDYERNPPTAENFYNEPITALGWQTERWFQICSEVVGGYWNSLGKSTVRINEIYSGTPGTTWSTATNTATVINYFGPSGLGYIPATPGELGGWSGGNATDINNAVNSGAFMLQHRDHGGESGWGEPAYNSSNINGLTNTDMPYVWSINCLTGRFDYGSEVFAEKFHRYTYNGENSGAVGITAASHVSYSFVNDVYVWGAYDNMWPDFMPDYGTEFPSNFILPAFASSAAKHFLFQSSWPYNTGDKLITYRLFHHHGDAFLNIYSEVPQDLSVTSNDIHIFGTVNFEATADDGSFLSLTYFDEDNQETVILATAEGTGSAVNMDMSECPEVGTKLLLTVTKQNYYRFTKEILVIAPDGPYLIVSDYNGSVNFGETVNMDITIENVGNEIANDVSVTISCTDPNAEIANATYVYGNINAGAASTSSGVFKISVDDALPDQYIIPIDIVITSSNKTLWEQTKNITVNSPVFELALNEINDISGVLIFESNPYTDVALNEIYSYDISVKENSGNGNGLLDPGETAGVIVNASNNGHAASLPATITLTTSNPEYVSVNTSEYTVGIIEIEETLPAIFSISIDENTPVGTVVELIFTLVSGEYTEIVSINLSVGLQIEDFETGDFSSYPWTMSGNADWLIDTDAHGGTYSAKSGTITHNQDSEMSVTIDVAADGEIAFWSKVSSESSYDFLRFYIDGSQQDQWSGTVAWGEHTYNITAGEHTLKWAYEKDGSVSSGYDCGWIDDITFPGHTSAKGIRSITITAPTLPDWLSLTDNGDGTGVLSGTAPAEQGLHDVVIHVVTDGEPAVQEFTINVGGVSVDALTGNISIFPNPNNGIFSIDLHSLSEIVDVRIQNINGQVIYQSETSNNILEVDITNYAKGVYFVTISSGREIYKAKIILN